MFQSGDPDKVTEIFTSEMNKAVQSLTKIKKGTKKEVDHKILEQNTRETEEEDNILEQTIPPNKETQRISDARKLQECTFKRTKKSKDEVLQKQIQNKLR